jgi:hypothetical protein
VARLLRSDIDLIVKALKLPYLLIVALITFFVKHYYQVQTFVKNRFIKKTFLRKHAGQVVPSPHSIFQA